MTDPSVDTRIESCLDAARACGEALAFMRGSEALAGDGDLAGCLSEAARVTSLSADCLARLPDLRDMVLRVCVEITERAALACARHVDEAPLAACGETLAACAAICTEGVELDMAAPSWGPQMGARPLH